MTCHIPSLISLYPILLLTQYLYPVSDEGTGLLLQNKFLLYLLYWQNR